MGREAAVMDWEQRFPFLREKGHVVSLVGGGGKTTLLYALSAYCAAKGWRVLTSTTTHIRKPMGMPWVAVEAGEKIPDAETAAMPGNEPTNKKKKAERGKKVWEKERDYLWQQGKYVVAGTPAAHEKLTILPEQLRNAWISDADITFLEADGAKRMPCKFPADHEPVILPQSDIVLAVAGLSALYRPLGEVCFRAELAIEAWNREMREDREEISQCEWSASREAQLPEETSFLEKEVPLSARASFSKENLLFKESPLTPKLLAWLLGSEKGAGKDTEGRSFFVVLNQADTLKRREDGRTILNILEQTYGIRGILTSFSETERNQE